MAMETLYYNGRMVYMQDSSYQELKLGKVVNEVYEIIRQVRKAKYIDDAIRWSKEAKMIVSSSYEHGMMARDIYMDLIGIVEKENHKAVKLIHSRQINESLRVANR